MRRDWRHHAGMSVIFVANLNVSVDDVFRPSTPAPLAGADLLYLGWEPCGLDLLGVVPDVDEAVQLQSVIGVHLSHVRDCNVKRRMALGVGVSRVAGRKPTGVKTKEW